MYSNDTMMLHVRREATVNATAMAQFWFINNVKHFKLKIISCCVVLSDHVMCDSGIALFNILFSTLTNHCI